MTPATSPVRRFGLATGVTALAAVLALTGTASHAHWSATDDLAVPARAGQVAISVTWPTAAISLQNHDRAATRGISVTNTSTQRVGSTHAVSAQLSVAPNAGTSAPLRANAIVTMWRLPNPLPGVGTPTVANCTNTVTPTAPVVTGAWASVASQFTTTLAPGATAIVCMRIATPETNYGATGFSTGNTGTTTASFSALGSLAGQAATSLYRHIPAAGSVAVSTNFIRPTGTVLAASSASAGDIKRVFFGAANYSNCLDSAWSGAAGAAVIGYQCGSHQENQRWRFVSVDTNWYRIHPTHETGSALAAVANEARLLAAPGGNETLWQLQQLGVNTYQLVNKASGYCLRHGPLASNTVDSPPPSALEVCSGAATQQFRVLRTPVTCTVTGLSPKSISMTFGAAIPAGSVLFVSTNTSSTAPAYNAANSYAMTVSGSSGTASFTASGDTTRRWELRTSAGDVYAVGSFTFAPTGVGQACAV